MTEETKQWFMNNFKVEGFYAASNRNVGQNACIVRN